MQSTVVNRSQDVAVNIIIAALWFGLVTGLLEGIGALSLQRFGRMPGVWVEILWVSPVFEAILFGLIGVGMAILALVFKRLPVFLVAIYVYLFLGFTILLGIAMPWQVHTIAILVLALGLATVFTRWTRNNQDKVLRIWCKTLPIAAAITVLAVIGIEGGGWLRERIATANLAEAKADAPNILLVVIDSLRADHLFSYGYSRETSPNLDRLASEGVLFERAFSTAPYTAPSHASLLTGYYPHQHGVQWGDRRPTFDGRYPTIAETLQEKGYRTGAFSSNRFWFTREQGFGRGFLHFEENFHSPGDMAMRTLLGQKLEEFVIKKYLTDYPWRLKSDRVNEGVVKWLEDDTDRPFFAMINYFDVHDPYFPPQPYRSMFSAQDFPGGIVNSHQERYDPVLTPDEVQDEKDAYDGAISYVDAHIGELLAQIEEMGLGDNLMVVVTSDHGEAFGEHGTFIHANSVYREEIHVPLIMWQPGQVPEGIRISQPVTNAAIPSTIISLLESRDENEFPGPALTRLWESPESAGTWAFPLSEMEHWPWMPETSPSQAGSIRSLASTEWHFVEHEQTGIELYDWNQDSVETVNLSGNTDAQAIIENFKGFLSTRFALK